MKWLHEGKESSVKHIAQVTVKAIRMARTEHDDVQFSFNNIPVVVNENTVPKEVTPLYEQARRRGDFRLIDARKGTKRAAFKVAVASLAAIIISI